MRINIWFRDYVVTGYNRFDYSTSLMLCLNPRRENNSDGQKNLPYTAMNYFNAKSLLLHAT